MISDRKSLKSCLVRILKGCPPAFLINFNCVEYPPNDNALVKRLLCNTPHAAAHPASRMAAAANTL